MVNHKLYWTKQGKVSNIDFLFHGVEALVKYQKRQTDKSNIFPKNLCRKILKKKNSNLRQIMMDHLKKK